MPDFVLDSLRGGYDDFTPISSLGKDACTVAENVEFFLSTLGERRAGTIDPLDTPPSIYINGSLYGVTWMFKHQSTAVITSYELWVLAYSQTAGVPNTPVMFRKTSSGWHNVAFPTPNDEPVGGSAFSVYGQSFHSKLFLAYGSNVDRLHVWDGLTLRRVGLAANSAPTAADTGGGAYAATQRYYRTRSVKRTGTTVLVRSEPSPSLAFTPSGAGTGVIVTRAALPGESETDWEIEVSLDNATFYKLSTIVAATTTYTDSAVTTTYSSNLQSDPIGTYSLIPSVQYLSADDDRLLLGGSCQVDADTSAVRWTPNSLDPSPGPDERLNSASNPRVDLDSGEGGGITAMSRVVAGALWVWKFGQTYRLVRTGQLVGAYEALPVTKARGAYPRSVVEANDEAGAPCHYFVDPRVGPMRAGNTGLQYLGAQVKNLFRAISPNALVPVHGVYYADKMQVHYWIARSGGVSSPLTPNTKVVLQTNLIQTNDAGMGMGCWATVPDSGSVAGIENAWCSCMFPVDILTLSLSEVPYIGKPKFGTVVFPVLQYCDTGTTDNGTAYIARVRSSPRFLANILNKFGIMSGAVLGSANSSFVVTARRDFGIETKAVTVTLTPVATETYVIGQMDDMSFSELFALEIEFGDNPLNVTQWRILQLGLNGRTEDTA